MLPSREVAWLAVDPAEAAFERRCEEGLDKHSPARRAHLEAAEQHRRLAVAHERAAQTHSDAAARGIGHVATHLDAVELYRAARDAEYRMAEQNRRLAERK